MHAHAHSCLCKHSLSENSNYLCVYVATYVVMYAVCVQPYIYIRTYSYVEMYLNTDFIVCLLAFFLKRAKCMHMLIAFKTE